MNSVVAAVAAYAVVAIAMLGSRSLSPGFRAQRRRLGGRRAQSRFRRAWATGRIPHGVDRDLWLAELHHWPGPPRFVRRKRTIYGFWGVLVLAVVALSFASGRGDPVYVVAAALPIVVLVLVFATILHFLPDPEDARARRTERLRARLESRRPEN